MKNQISLTALGRIGTLAAATALLVGCGAPNGTTPMLTLDSVYVGSSAADVDVTIANPGPRSFQLTQVDYTLTVGPLPIASGAYETDTEIPSGGQVEMTFTAPIDQPPLDASATDAQLTGALHFEGGGAQTPSRSAFSATTNSVRR